MFPASEKFEVGQDGGSPLVLSRWENLLRMNELNIPESGFLDPLCPRPYPHTADRNVDPPLVYDSGNNLLKGGCFDSCNLVGGIELEFFNSCAKIQECCLWGPFRGHGRKSIL